MIQEVFKKPKRYFVVPVKNLLPYQKQDKELQEKQNELILKTLRWTIILGVLAVVAQLGEIISGIILR